MRPVWVKKCPLAAVRRENSPLSHTFDLAYNDCIPLAFLAAVTSGLALTAYILA